MVHPRPSILRIAHRGNTHGRRENTLPAFASAIEVGCDWLEVDVRTTRDGSVVVVHDATLRRLWGLPAPVGAVDLHEVRSLGLADTRIPTLTDVLDLAADQGVGVLVDSTNSADALAAHAVASRHPAVVTGRLPLQYCGDTGAMLAVRDADPDAVLQLGHPGGALDTTLIERLRPAVVNAEWSLFDVPLIEQIHAHRMLASAWTVNDATGMEWLATIGIDAITTDRVRLLNRVLVARLPFADPLDSQPAARIWPAVDVEHCLWVAREIADWTIAYTRDAPLGAVTTKAHAADVVTEVDTGVERHVRSVLATEFPTHLVVGEEEGGASRPGVPTWYLDPVDGTTNLANGLPWTSMSLALAVDDTPLVAVVAHPWLGHVLAAGREQGSFLDGERLRLGEGSALGVLLTELSAHQPWEGMAAMTTRAADAHVTLRVMGSGTLTLAGVAAGWGQAAVVHAFNPIDHLAALLLVREAGGVVLGEDGRETLFPERGTGVLVAAPGVAQRAYELWRGHVA